MAFPVDNPQVLRSHNVADNLLAYRSALGDELSVNEPIATCALAKDRATTMGHIKRSALRESKVLIPPESVFADLTEMMRPIVDEMVGLKVHSRKPGESKDALSAEADVR